ncbi:PLP-dependent aminotransferase family protein [Pseudomonas alcaligenes]|uniref:aminotransferase-like domain-containing protein n=1 Tax=Pseudomonas sp. RIT-PI-AD TaxID=3035294 RepID=UPI0021DB267D
MSKGTTEGAAFAYQAVYRYLVELIETGRPGSEQKLPSLRQLATRLNVSVSTVKYAYSLLEDEGRLYAKPKSGYFAVAVNTPALSEGSPDLLDDVFANARQPGMLALSSDAPSMLLSLENPLLMMERELARQYPRPQAPLYQPFGESELRGVLADRYTLSTERYWQAEDVYIGSDLRSVLELTLAAFGLAGSVALVESPCSWATLRQLQAVGIRVIELPLGDDGRFDLQRLEDLLRREPIRLAVLSSAVSVPHGSLMPEADKALLARWLGERGIWLFENDSYGEFCFTPSPPRYRDHADPERLLVFSTFDKIIGSEAPYGYLLCRRFGSAFRHQFLGRAFRLPPIRQKAIARLFTSGRIDQHIALLRAMLLERMQRMGSLLQQTTEGQLRLVTPRGGATFWAEAIRPVDMRRVFERLLAQRIVIAPGEIFSLDGSYRQHLRLSYTIDWSKDIRAALQAMAQALADESREP